MKTFINWVLLVVGICMVIYAFVVLFLFPDPEKEDEPGKRAPGSAKRNNAAFPEVDFEPSNDPHKRPEL